MAARIRVKVPRVLLGMAAPTSRFDTERGYGNPHYRCETGETHDTCPEDCLLRTVACPALATYTKVGLHHAACGGNGLCDPSVVEAPGMGTNVQGTCMCFPGYTGITCEVCDEGYIEVRLQLAHVWAPWVDSIAAGNPGPGFQAGRIVQELLQSLVKCACSI